MICVVIGEPSEGARDADSLALLRYGLGQFRGARVVNRGGSRRTPTVEYHEDDRVDIVPARDAALTVRRGERVTQVVDAPDELEGPLPRGRAGRRRWRSPTAPGRAAGPAGHRRAGAAAPRTWDKLTSRSAAAPRR